ncbi:MAG: MgtC/SapB family protein [Deltaproteobacteria bacterium]|nr:MgtC/SapB family protein [Deltaproteobacteria bacterium]
MDLLEPFISLGIALAAGLLIGMERQQAAPEEDGSFLGGARTHPLFSLMGACSMLLARQVGVAAVIVGLAASASFLVVAYVDDVRRDRDRGLTSEIAFLISFALGALALSQGVIEPLEHRVSVVAALAVTTTLLLSIKPSLHSLVRKASKEDVFATLKFLVVAVIVLPLLPNRTVGPLDVINPYKMGLMVVLISGISFVGFFAIRILGTRRGLGLTGVVGGLVSSTAVTLTFSGRAKEEPALHGSFALAVVLASTIMSVRVLITVAVVNAALLPRLAIPMGAMALGGLLSSAWLFQRSRKVESAGSSEVQFSNPFELSSAVKFAALFAVILLAAKAATTYFSTGAIYLTGVLAGTTDVDAITLSMARLAQGGLAPEVAVTTILLGVGSNSVVKGAMATIVGGWLFGRTIAAAFGLSLFLGGLGLLAVWLMP